MEDLDSQDKEEFAAADEELKRKYDVLLQTNTEQALLLQELRQQQDIDRQQRLHEQQQYIKDVEVLKRSYAFKYEKFLVEMEMLECKLKEFEQTSSNLDPPIQNISSPVSTATNVNSPVDMMQLEEFIRKSKDYDYKGCKESVRKRFQDIEVSFASISDKIQEKIDNIEEEMESMGEDFNLKEETLLETIMAQEKMVKDIEEDNEKLKKLIIARTEDKEPKINSQRTASDENDLNTVTAHRDIHQKINEPTNDILRLLNSNEMAQRSEQFSDSNVVTETDDYSTLALDSSYNIVDKCRNTYKVISECFGCIDRWSLLKTTLIKYTYALNSIHAKRKINQSDRDEPSKKMKLSIDRTCQEEESTEYCTPKANRTLMELEGELSELSKLRFPMVVTIIMQKNSLKKLMLRYQNLSKEKRDLANAMDLSAHNTTSGSEVLRASAQQSSSTPTDTSLSQQSCSTSTNTSLSQHPGSSPVLPITREDVKRFFESDLFCKATFSKTFYLSAVNHDNFLSYSPIGIMNHRATFCYLNSVLQALSNIPLFALTAICGFNHEENTLFHAMYQTYKYLWVRQSDRENRNRPLFLYADEVINYYYQHHSATFDHKRQHDADEFLVDLIGNLEVETLKFCVVDQDNYISKLFRGYIIDLDGKEESFVTLRLSIADERIDSIRNALLYHLRIVRPPRPSRPVPQFNDTFGILEILTAYSSSTEPACNSTESHSSLDPLQCSNIKSLPFTPHYASEPCPSAGSSSNSNAIPYSEYPITPRHSTSLSLTRSPTSIQPNSSSLTCTKFIPSEKKSKFPNISFSPVPPTDTLGSNLSMPIVLKSNSPSISVTPINSDYKESLKDSPMDVIACIPIPAADVSSAEINSAYEETGDCDTKLCAISSHNNFSSDNLITGTYRKIYTPEILCVSLDRYDINLIFNSKVLPAEDLVIPADLRAPEGTTRPAFYKLMSIVQYIRTGSESGHYYTYVKTESGDGYMLNDNLVSRVKNEAFDLTAYGGRSVIFVYAKLPDSLDSPVEHRN